MMCGDDDGYDSDDNDIRTGAGRQGAINNYGRMPK